MAVRAKFYVTYKTPRPPIEGETAGGADIHMAAVSGDYDAEGNNAAEENRIFGKWTPNAHLEMGVDNPAAAAQFEPGKTYYLDFTPAE